MWGLGAAMLAVSGVVSWLIWQRPWMTPDDRQWERIIQTRGPEYALMRDVLRAGEPGLVQRATDTNVAVALRGIGSNNVAVRETGYGALAFLSRNPALRQKCVRGLERIKQDPDPSLATSFAHYAMYARLEGWQDLIEQDLRSPNPEVRKRAERDVKTAIRWEIWK
jgi:hypothetical protein